MNLVDHWFGLEKKSGLSTSLNWFTKKKHRGGLLKTWVRIPPQSERQSGPAEVLSQL